MGRIIRGMTGVAFAAALAAPAAAESWTRFSASDRTIYLVDLDSLALMDGVAATRIARVPLAGDATDLSHEVEVADMRCADGQSRSGLTIAYGPDGAETDRYEEETPWAPAHGGALYASVLSFACEDMRPEETAYPTIAAFIAAGRGR